MNKLRCIACKEYFLPDVMYRTGRLSAVCSSECFASLSRKRQTSKKKSGGADEMKWKTATRTRDGNACRWCGATGNLHVHHIRYRSEGGSNELDNLVTLCSHHHEAVHSNKSLYKSLLLELVRLGSAGTFLHLPEVMAKYGSQLET